MRYAEYQRVLLLFAVAAAVAVSACGPSQMVSETSLEERLAGLKIGQTTRSGVASALGTDRGNDDKRWLFYISDSAFSVRANQHKFFGGILPVTAGVTPTNTRAIIMVSFDDAGVLSRLEVERFFEQPFVNDYWFQVKDSAKEPLRSFAGIADSMGFKVIGLDKDAGSFALEDSSSLASIAVMLQGQTLRLTSKNPHDRLASEYRAYRKREAALLTRIADSGLIH